MKRFVVLAVSLIAALTSAAVQAEEVLKMSNWLPPTHPITTQIIKPWIESIREKSGGRLIVRPLPMALGAPPAHFSLARDGVADRQAADQMVGQRGGALVGQEAAQRGQVFP